jgi:hypothetical protein
MTGMRAIMTHIEPLVEAAKTLASGKGESVLAKAGIVLADMKRAVETIVGRELEVMKRTSKSSGTERLSFVMGKTVTGPARKMHDAKRFASEVALLEKAGDAVDHLKARGLDAEHVMKGSNEPGYNIHLVDVVLNDKVLGYIPGKNTASLSGGSGIVKGL